MRVFNIRHIKYWTVRVFPLLFNVLGFGVLLSLTFFGFLVVLLFLVFSIFQKLTLGLLED